MIRNRFIARQWQNWINRKIPRADFQRFNQKNIFILPTGAGCVFALLLVILLITGTNYQNSLIYLTTFLLGTVFIGAMHQTHRNLTGLELSLVKAGSDFAGQEVGFRFRAKASGASVAAIVLSYEGKALNPIHIPFNRTKDVTILIPADKRGYFLPDKIRVESRFPFGLLKAWSWFRPATPAVVYPSPLSATDSAGMVPDEDMEESSENTIDDNDHAELRPWREGDLSQRVMWKRYARSGQMVVADWQGEGGSPQWLDFDGFQGVDHELRLRYLAFLVNERGKIDVPFGLRLPGEVIEPDAGPVHIERCLRALAVWGLVVPQSANSSSQGSERGTAMDNASEVSP